MRIAVLGATGVYGRHLVPRLAAAGHRVSALVRRPAAATIAAACGAELAPADIFDEASLRAGLTGCEVAVNLATSLPSPSTRGGDFARNDQLRPEGTPLFVRACRDSDEIFRYGGDEFAIILPGSETPGALEVAGRIGRAVRELGADTATGARISCSVGVASWPADATDRDGLIVAADRACYAAKAAGRDRAAAAADVPGDASLAAGPLEPHGRPAVGAGSTH